MTVPVVTVARDVLLPALTLVTRAVERRNTIPILANLRLHAGGGTLTLTATDLDAELSAQRPATIAGGAVETTLPAQNLVDIVRKLPEGCEVTLSGDAAVWTVSAGRARFRLPCLPASDFPQMAADDLPHGFTLPVATLRAMLETTRFAISTEETRYYLNGIYWHETVDGESALLVAVATDGHRLARAPAALPAPSGMPGVILPRKTVGLVTRMLPDKGEVEVRVAATKIRFAIEGGTALVSRLIDGTYPDYQRVVPQANASRFAVDRAALAAAVDRVTTISASRGGAVKFGFGDAELALAASSPEAGSAEETLAIEMLAGSPVEIGFNGRYVLDMLAATAAESVVFALADGGSPALVEPQGAEPPAPYFVIMPMRV